MAPPFWVIGAPRSGTTFLARVLDHHPDIFLTNETRLMLLVSRVLSRYVNHRRVLASHRDEIVDSLWEHLPALVERVYRDLGATPGQRWGDKYPQYADGEQDPEALMTIDRLFPEGQYIHIIRDPRAVVASIVAKKWLGFDEATVAWRTFVTHAQSFGSGVGPGRYHELRFESLVSNAVETVNDALAFLALDPAREVDIYLGSQESKRDRLSFPMGEPGAVGSEAWQGRLDEFQVATIEDRLGDQMSDLGYQLSS